MPRLIVTYCVICGDIPKGLFFFLGGGAVNLGKGESGEVGGRMGGMEAGEAWVVCNV